MQSPPLSPGSREQHAPGMAATPEDEPAHTTADAPHAAPNDAICLRTAAALEVAAHDRAGSFGPFDAFQLMADVVRDAVMDEAEQQGARYFQVLGGVRRQDALGAAAHQAAAGKARQARPDAAAHQVEASRRAAEARTAAAMSQEEARAKKKREVRAAAKAAAKAKATASAEEQEEIEAVLTYSQWIEREYAMFGAVAAAVEATGDFAIDDNEWEEFLREFDRVHTLDDDEVIEVFRLWRQEETANNQARRARRESKE